MKRIYVSEKWCLGCHLCEYYCAFANSGSDDMAKALMNRRINPRIQVEERSGISFAVSCRHCEEPLCVKSCITGALSSEGGLITIDKNRCVACHTCVLACPYGTIMPSDDGMMQKCELCLKNAIGEPACVKYCPNRAIIYEDSAAPAAAAQ
ncbi:MAG: 4Fe-4S binding protein [Oscillospiraceae bacterium]|jgi:carbon-monoxide dehydrogenase iron sulfur subunit|nr:4Fe-4S binding protein [Oscillospiraceae bacterium]